eukprot:541525-Rhodomonas_salina.1
MFVIRFKARGFLWHSGGTWFGINGREVISRSNASSMQGDLAGERERPMCFDQCAMTRISMRVWVESAAFKMRVETRAIIGWRGGCLGDLAVIGCGGRHVVDDERVFGFGLDHLLQAKKLRFRRDVRVCAQVVHGGGYGED